MAFAPPGPDEWTRAIGPLNGVSADLRRAFTPNDDFEPLPAPGRLDWLNVVRERGQTFERFARTSTSRPDDTRRHIYLQPVGEFALASAELLGTLQRFGAAFFARDVRLLPAIAVGTGDIKTRRNRYTGVLQLNSRDILRLLAGRLPPDACCLLGVASDDLYPHDTWSFVFGEAIVDDRVGVFSVARYDPGFYDQPADDPTLLIRRTCKVLAHETCHMLGMRHCVFFNCLMNGSNHLAESDRRPLHLCPVDLRKLHWSLGFELVGRDRRLAAFWRGVGVGDEAAWIERRLATVLDPANF
jgi:archaemetzincin